MFPRYRMHTKDIAHPRPKNIGTVQPIFAIGLCNNSTKSYNLVNGIVISFKEIKFTFGNKISFNVIGSQFLSRKGQQAKEKINPNKS